MKQPKFLISNSKITGAGLGLFATTDFKKGQDILEVKGKTLTAAEYSIKLAKGIGAWKYCIEISNDLIMDMTSLNCIARCANDAKGSSFKNNAVVEYNSDGKLYFVATKNIIAGEEILVKYGTPYWKSYDKNIKKDSDIQKLLKLGFEIHHLDDYSGWWYELNLNWVFGVIIEIIVDLDTNKTSIGLEVMKNGKIDCIDIYEQKLDISKLPALIKTFKTK